MCIEKLLLKNTQTEDGEIFNVYNYKNEIFVTNVNGKLISSESLVCYKSLYEDNKWYLRPIEMFLSKVDKEKYPMVTQEIDLNFYLSKRFKKPLTLFISKINLLIKYK